MLARLDDRQLADIGLTRSDLRDALTRLERTPRRTISGGSQLGRIYTFLGAKGGVGTTALAVNFATVLSQRKKQTVMLDVNWTANDVAMQLGAAPQYTLLEVGENLDRMDQSLFEGFVTRDPAGFLLVGPPDSLEQPRSLFSDSMLREFTTFLVEKYDAIVTGVRAFNTRADVRANARRLHEYAQNGGTLVVQYNVMEGGFFEHHGEIYDVPSIKISPIPSTPVPLLVGGHGEPALRRA